MGKKWIVEKLYALGQKAENFVEDNSMGLDEKFGM